MSAYVVDASVAAKWIFEEIHSAAAHNLLLSSAELLAPEFIEIEIGNILWKKVRSGTVAREDGDAQLALFRSLNLSLFSTQTISHAAYYIAVETDRTYYDSLYLALAISQNCLLVTADRKFYNAVRPTPFGSNIQWIEDLK
jgi:predicted nucleic acid-binding protein